MKRYKQNISDEKLVRMQRIAVVVISLLAFLMSLKSDVAFAVALLASAGLGSTFGPLVLFCLYSKNVNKTGAIASMVVGLFTVIIWYYSGMSSYVYEAIPGFIASSLALILGTKLSGGADRNTVKEYEIFIERLSNKRR